MSNTDIRLRSWIKANAADEHTGMLGFVSAFVGNLIVDGIVLRRTESGRLALSFPARTDRAGRRHWLVRPVDDAARRAIERVLLGQLEQHLDAGLATEDQP